MKAAVISEHGGPGSIRIDNDFPDPQPRPDDVVIRVRALTLNYHDLFTRNGMPGIKIPMPAVMGLDFCGEVVELGSDIKDWSVGDRVMVDPIDRVHGTGLIGETSHGGLAEYCRVPAHQLVTLPESVPFAHAACLPVAYGTALRMMYTVGDVQAGDRVLILGASGGVGTCAVQLAKRAGCEVVACSSSQSKMDRLTEIGADRVVNYLEEDFVKWVYQNYDKPHRREFDKSKGIGVVVNFTGGDTWVKSLRVLHRGGKVLTCGATAGYDPVEDIRFIWTFELKVLGSNGWMRDDLHELIRLLEDGSLKPIIDKTLPLEEVNEAFRLLEEREVFGKVVIEP